MNNRRRMITVRETSLFLDVSEATVRNWVRHGFLSPAQNNPKVFKYSEVLSLKKQLASGKINRLKQRANRTRLARMIIPAEYVDDVALAGQAENIRKIFISKHLGLEKAMFCLTARLLVLKKEVRIQDPGRIFQASAYSGWQRQSVETQLLAWLEEKKFSNVKDAGKYLDLYHALESTTRDDVLGLLYQSLRREGNRSRQGMYYTPEELLAGVINSRGKGGGRFLDPCCGTGRFLTYAARSGRFQPEDLIGFDNDPIAARVARVNLLLMFSGREFVPRVFCLDVLDPKKIRPYRQSFHLIATNPPWGAKLTPTQQSRMRKAYPAITSGESFSFFLAAGLDLLAKDGRLSFILPESILNIRAHRDIRKHLLSSTTLMNVVFLGRRFGSVLSSVIRIDIKKTAPAKKVRAGVVRQDGRVCKVPQARFLKNDNYIIDARLTEPEAGIIKKIYDFPHVTLAGAADWALGIVTGDNRQYLSDVCQKGMEPVYRGTDIDKYRLRTPDAFIRFTPDRFQQTAPESKYRVKEKLIYRFVSRRLVFALDNNGILTLNSANILIPKIEHYPVKAILGILNSQVSQFVFTKKFHSLKVLKNDLETLPLPLLGATQLNRLVELVDRALAGKAVADEIDALIMAGLGLTEKEKRVILEAEV